VTPQSALALAIDPALRLLPDRMTSRPAKVLVLAIALQESRLKYRVQIGGPARGYWMFESGGGVAGVLRHHASKPHIESVCEALNYPPSVNVCYRAIEHNDVLAAAFARLLLWTLPQALPTSAARSWDYYLEAWRPGRPHPEPWAALYAQAQAAVTA